jgi:hypothetical protein
MSHEQAVQYSLFMMSVIHKRDDWNDLDFWGQAGVYSSPGPFMRKDTQL